MKIPLLIFWILSSASLAADNALKIYQDNECIKIRIPKKGAGHLDLYVLSQPEGDVLWNLALGNYEGGGELILGELPIRKLLKYQHDSYYKQNKYANIRQIIPKQGPPVFPRETFLQVRLTYRSNLLLFLAPGSKTESIDFKLSNSGELLIP